MMAHCKRPLIISLRPQTESTSDSSLSNNVSASFLTISNQESVYGTPPLNFCSFEDASNESLDSDNELPSSRKRKFVLKWKVLFPFIEYDDVKGVMFCKVCKQHASKTQKRVRFVIGTDNFRRTSIEYHKRSALHEKCVEKSKKSACETGVKFYDRDKEKLSLVLKLVYFSIKSKRPYSYFPVLCDTQRKEGVDLGSAYTSHQGVVPLFSHYISCVLESSLAKGLSSVGKFSLILDHTFSRTSESHELVYIKCLKEDVLETIFIGVVDSSANLSSHLIDGLGQVFAKYDIRNWKENVVYVYVDTLESCPVWLDEFFSYLNEKSSQNVSFVKFLPHKVAQPYEVFKKYQFISNFTAIICDIFQYCSKSPKFRKGLPNINDAITEMENKYGCLPKINFSYLNFQNLGALLEDFILLVNLLKENNSLICMKDKQKGAKILLNITSYRFIWELSLILDLLSCLNDFSVSIKNQQFMPFTLLHEIHNLCSKIHISTEGNSSNALFCAKEMSKTGSSLRNLFGDTFNISEIVEEMKKVGSSLADAIKMSLPSESVLKHLQILDTRYWPRGECLTSFGVDEFTKLYHGLIESDENLSQALEEWNVLKSNVSLCFTADSLKNPSLALKHMISLFDSQLPVVTSILEKVLLLDFSTSELEKGQREINGLKSTDRSTLSIRSLQSSMMILVHGPPLSEFDPAPAMRLWLGQGKRRYRCRKKKVNS